MTGTIKIKDKVFIFRNDSADDNRILAWDISTLDNSKIMTHKWDKLPKGEVTLFDVDDIPDTVNFIPDW